MSSGCHRCGGLHAHALLTRRGCLSHQLRKFIAGLLLYAHHDQHGVKIHHTHPASSEKYEDQEVQKILLQSTWHEW